MCPFFSCHTRKMISFLTQISADVLEHFQMISHKTNISVVHHVLRHLYHCSEFVVVDLPFTIQPIHNQICVPSLGFHHAGIPNPQLFSFLHLVFFLSSSILLRSSFAPVREKPLTFLSSSLFRILLHSPSAVFTKLFLIFGEFPPPFTTTPISSTDCPNSCAALQPFFFSSCRDS